MDPQSLANVLNTHVFSANDAPLKDISITIEKGRLKVKGKLHQKGDIGFETEGQLSATADGKIRLRAEKIRALHLPVKGLMDLFGVDIADLIKNGKVRGVQVEKDDLILDPAEILPPPKISGKITDIHLEGNNIVQIFGDPKKYPWIKVPAQNYMAYRGNKLQFGKLLMSDTDLVLIDPAPKDPFDFYLDRYKDQLVAGYSKTTPTFGLNVYMVDFNKLKKAAAQGKAAKTAVRRRFAYLCIGRGFSISAAAVKHFAGVYRQCTQRELQLGDCFVQFRMYCAELFTERRQELMSAGDVLYRF